MYKPAKDDSFVFAEVEGGVCFWGAYFWRHSLTVQSHEKEAESTLIDKTSVKFKSGTTTMDDSAAKPRQFVGVEIATLPNAFARLESLTSLALNKTRLTAVPPVLSHLTNMRNLVITVRAPPLPLLPSSTHLH